MNLFFETLLAAELNARAAFGFGAVHAGTFQIIRAMLDVRLQLLSHFIFDCAAMEEPAGEGAKVRK